MAGLPGSRETGIPPLQRSDPPIIHRVRAHMPAVWGLPWRGPLSSGWHARSAEAESSEKFGSRESGEKRLQHHPTLPASPANLDAYFLPATARLIFGCRHISTAAATTRVFLDANHGKHAAMSPFLPTVVYS